MVTVGPEVIWSQVIWGQGWGSGRGMNLNNGSPQTRVIGGEYFV